MRYERLKDIVRLAIRLQGMRTGLTLDDIGEEFGVSRRTAERLRETVEGAFGPLESVDGEGQAALLAPPIERVTPARSRLTRRAG